METFQQLAKHPKMEELLQGMTQVVSSLPSEKEDSHAKGSHDTRGKAPMVERQHVVKTPSRASGPKDFVAFGHGTVNDDKEKAHVVEQSPVGVYGFAAYSASKFGLKGMAEALQQEIHCYNIRVSLIYPPDTFTPGLEKENETKPEITKVISGSSTAMDAVDVARKAVDGIKAGNFSISCNFDGWMLCIATAGMSPQPSTVLAFAEIFLSGILRLVGLCYIWIWYQTLVKWTKQHNKDK
ncbi:hypothetical protein L7F22_038156 [Adiantum nelumboides]|nr:hypothetical protein [Adiantum nelumboides]